MRALGKEIPGDLYLRAITLDKLRRNKPALEAYRQFLAVGGGKFPNEEFLSRQRARIIENELEMTLLLYALLFFFAAARSADSGSGPRRPNPEHRAKAAVDYAALAERAAESANDTGDAARLAAEAKNMVAAMELARDSFIAAGKTPGPCSRGPSRAWSCESHSCCTGLADLQNKTGCDQKAQLDGPIMKVQEIHDAWFDGIMGKKN